MNIPVKGSTPESEQRLQSQATQGRSDPVGQILHLARNGTAFGLEFEALPKRSVRLYRHFALPQSTRPQTIFLPCKWQTKALEMIAKDQTQTTKLKTARLRLAMYKAGTPYHAVAE
jgi:hypothetical protein